MHNGADVAIPPRFAAFGLIPFSSLAACIISTSHFRFILFCRHGFKGFIIDWRYFLVSSFVRYLM